MARFRRRGGLPAALGPGEQQTTIFDRLEIFPRLVEVHDPVRPAVKLLCAVLAMMGMGLLLQASHAATILPPKAFASEVVERSSVSSAWLRCCSPFASVPTACGACCRSW